MTRKDLPDLEEGRKPKPKPKKQSFGHRRPVGILDPSLTELEFSNIDTEKLPSGFLLGNVKGFLPLPNPQVAEESKANPDNQLAAELRAASKNKDVRYINDFIAGKKGDQGAAIFSMTLNDFLIFVRKIKLFAQQQRLIFRGDAKSEFTDLIIGRFIADLNQTKTTDPSKSNISNSQILENLTLLEALGAKSQRVADLIETLANQANFKIQDFQIQGYRRDINIAELAKAIFKISGEFIKREDSALLDVANIIGNLSKIDEKAECFSNVQKDVLEFQRVVNIKLAKLKLAAELKLAERPEQEKDFISFEVVNTILQFDFWYQNLRGVPFLNEQNMAHFIAQNQEIESSFTLLLKNSAKQLISQALTSARPESALVDYVVCADDSDNHSSDIKLQHKLDSSLIITISLDEFGAVKQEDLLKFLADQIAIGEAKERDPASILAILEEIPATSPTSSSVQKIAPESANLYKK